MNLTAIDWIIMLVYFAFVLGIGAALKRYMKTSTDFFLSGRSIPAWVAGSAMRPAEESREGREIEEAEHREGLERERRGH